MKEIEQAAKERYPNWYTDFMEGAKKSAFTAGAEFYKNALSQKFEGLREEFETDFLNKMGDMRVTNPAVIVNWFKEKMLK